MKIEKSFISCPIIKSKFADHEKIKDKVLQTIDEHDYPALDYGITFISKTDWTVPQETFRPYKQHIFPSLGDHLHEVYSSMGYVRVNIHNLWFQQYTKGGGHKWHIHVDCQWTNVYYIEMPEGAPFLQLVDPRTDQVLDIDVEEGDVLSFPSFVTHRSPDMESDTRKTIISCNSCADIAEEDYI